MGKPNWWKTACAVFLLCAATAIALPAQTFTTVHSFDKTDGANPLAALVQATNGALLGTTQSGGANHFGTIFRITPSGTLTKLYDFCSQGGSSCTDGSSPKAGLVQATDENFYGTTFSGGANNNNEFCSSTGCGTIFKITPSGTLTTLYSFCAQSGCTDGTEPIAGLVQATDGNFYGTTGRVGANGLGGTVFMITPGGTLTTLYSFCSQSGCADGKFPEAALIQATDGNFYGTTDGGGVNDMGTVFKITPGGTLTTLYRFCAQSGCTDGELPQGALVQAADGNFYGTTFSGGANHNNNFCDSAGCGTIFKITPSGMLATLYSFCAQSGCTDGTEPVAGLVQATDGNFYGTTPNGGSPTDVGTVFNITPSGTLTTLHILGSQSGDGFFPVAALVQDTDGNLYGTTSSGGANGDGTVFSLSVSLGPFVETQRTFGKVGMAVKILGTNLTGATSVSFNGTAATFTVVSSSLITTSVPSGATTGTVQVVTPSGTLSSNVPFRVLP
ncbi:MAG TPA: choice-of-anchor tandem repeat GloVer-containing protein [Terriglobia bacterium]|nr:choice-of-anchor tandem repeat GloVer-containing protein [Terriglobia bacterium]